ncbi:MAG TPA: hypothetical protein VMW62_06480 [Chloroflexota bacterium]|nr:hypothetical protein [Chloroflexota bacterium]
MMRLQSLSTGAIAAGELKQSVDVTKLVDMSFAQNAVRVLGPYK